jgi:hypothetical protein
MERQDNTCRQKKKIELIKGEVDMTKDKNKVIQKEMIRYKEYFSVE